jgi:hypothetical protein
LHHVSDKKNVWGFVIDEVGVGCNPILDLGLGPIYKTGEETDVSFIPFCESDSNIWKRLEIRWPPGGIPTMAILNL